MAHVCPLFPARPNLLGPKNVLSCPSTTASSSGVVATFSSEVVKKNRRGKISVTNALGLGLSTNTYCHGWWDTSSPTSRSRAAYQNCTPGWLWTCACACSAATSDGSALCASRSASSSSCWTLRRAAHTTLCPTCAICACSLFMSTRGVSMVSWMTWTVEASMVAIPMPLKMDCKICACSASGVLVQSTIPCWYPSE
jgi:hypothetical protein